MANLSASKKDIRKSARRRVANSQKKSRLRTYDKQIRALVLAGNIDEASVLFQTYSSYLDRAGKINLIHHRQADRRKSRMASLIGKGRAETPKSES